MGGGAELLAMYLSVRYRAGRRRSWQGRQVGIESVSLSLSASKASVRAAVQDELAEQASSQLTTQTLRESTWSTQSSGSSSSSSPGAGSHLERPSGPRCLSAGMWTSLKSNKRMAAIQQLMAAFGWMSGLRSMPLI